MANILQQPIALVYKVKLIESAAYEMYNKVKMMDYLFNNNPPFYFIKIKA